MTGSDQTRGGGAPYRHATALTGSQEYVGWDGLEYDVFLNQLKAAPTMSADQLAINSSKSTVIDKTWSAVAVDSRLDTLNTAVDQWSVALTNGLAANKKAHSSAMGQTKSYVQAPMDKDLYDLASRINGKVTDMGIRAKGQAVMDAYSTVVLHERHVANYAGSHGITIYAPATKAQKSNDAYFRTVDFALQTHWDEFLTAYLP